MYNGLGLLAHHYHSRSSGQMPFVLSWDYDAGMPVTGYVNGIPMVKNVGYQRSGALLIYKTGIGVTDVTTTITQDSSLLPRPASIATLRRLRQPAVGASPTSGDGVAAGAAS